MNPLLLLVLSVSLPLLLGGCGGPSLAELTELAEKGDAEAQYRLARYYEKLDNSVANGDVEAVKWYRKAAEQGHAEAQYGLGFMYEHGYGIEGSSIPELARTEAFKWHQREEAFKWYQKAADQGNLWAKEILKTDWWQVMQVVLQNRQEVEGETEGVNWDELEGRGIIWYLKGSDTPYTGKVYGLHENGQKLGEGGYKDGKHEGLWTEWYENGNKKKEYNYKDGKKDGLSVYWHENGHKWLEENYKDHEVVSMKLWNSKGEPVESMEEAQK